MEQYMSQFSVILSRLLNESSDSGLPNYVKNVILNEFKSSVKVVSLSDMVWGGSKPPAPKLDTSTIGSVVINGYIEADGFGYDLSYIVMSISNLNSRYQFQLYYRGEQPHQDNPRSGNVRGHWGAWEELYVKPNEFDDIDLGIITTISNYIQLGSTSSADSESGQEPDSESELEYGYHIDQSKLKPTTLIKFKSSTDLISIEESFTINNTDVIVNDIQFGNVEKLPDEWFYTIRTTGKIIDQRHTYDYITHTEIGTDSTPDAGILYINAIDNIKTKAGYAYHYPDSIIIKSILEYVLSNNEVSQIIENFHEAYISHINNR